MTSRDTQPAPSAVSTYVLYALSYHFSTYRSGGNSRSSMLFLCEMFTTSQMIRRYSRCVHSRKVLSVQVSDIDINGKKTPEFSCIAHTSSGTVIADLHGSLYTLNQDFEITKSWIAHSSGRVTHMVERIGILITLGVRYPIIAILFCRS